MNDFDKILLGFLFSIGGAIFGWTLNQLGQWVRTRHEDKKILKSVLFNLLETFYIFVRSDIDKYVQKITDKVKSELTLNEQTDEFNHFIKTLYSGIIANTIRPELQKEIKIIEHKYQNSIETLATVDPLIAFYLSGRTNIIESFHQIDALFDNLLVQFPGEQREMQDGVNQVLNVIKPDIFRDTLVDLESDIKKIAWKINPYVWFKSTRTIIRLKKNANEKFDKELDKLFDKISPLVNMQ